MQSITLASEQRKNLIQKMKRERKPSRRLRMHIVLLSAEGRSPTEIARALLCSRTTVYAVVSRFVQKEQAAFDDRKRRGPKPLLEGLANEYIERLVEEESPTSHGWLRSRWSCELLAYELLKERMIVASRETLRRTLHRLGFRWRRPRPVPAEKDSEDRRDQKRRRLLDVLSMVKQAGSFFQDETRLETNPLKVGFCWMRRGKQKPLRTPGTNRKVWISGALNSKTGRFHWVAGERKNAELFMKLLDKLRRTSRCHKELHLAVDNDSSHTSKRVEKYVEDSNGRIHPSASFALMVSREQPGRAGVVVSTRGGEPQPRVRGVGRPGGIRRRLPQGEAALHAEAGRSLRTIVGKVAALRSASVHLFRGAI
jgi:transposase